MCFFKNGLKLVDSFKKVMKIFIVLRCFGSKFVKCLLKFIRKIYFNLLSILL